MTNENKSRRIQIVEPQRLRMECGMVKQRIHHYREHISRSKRNDGFV